MENYSVVDITARNSVIKHKQVRKRIGQKQIEEIWSQKPLYCYFRLRSPNLVKSRFYPTIARLIGLYILHRTRAYLHATFKLISCMILRTKNTGSVINTQKLLNTLSQDAPYSDAITTQTFMAG